MFLEEGGKIFNNNRNSCFWVSKFLTCIDKAIIMSEKRSAQLVIRVCFFFPFLPFLAHTCWENIKDTYPAKPTIIHHLLGF